MYIALSNINDETNNNAISNNTGDDTLNILWKVSNYLLWLIKAEYEGENRMSLLETDHIQQFKI